MDYYGGLDHFGKDKIIDCSLRVSVFLTYPNQLLRSFPMTSIGDIQRREERQRIKHRKGGMRYSTITLVKYVTLNGKSF